MMIMDSAWILQFFRITLKPPAPPTPHVGGPITMGSATVLIGNQPAARVGDMATCTGPPPKPPDTIAPPGCPTVIIGP